MLRRWRTLSQIGPIACMRSDPLEVDSNRRGQLVHCPQVADGGPQGDEEQRREDGCCCNAMLCRKVSRCGESSSGARCNTSEEIARSRRNRPEGCEHLIRQLADLVRERGQGRIDRGERRLRPRRGHAGSHRRRRDECGARGLGAEREGQSCCARCLNEGRRSITHRCLGCASCTTQGSGHGRCGRTNSAPGRGCAVAHALEEGTQSAGRGHCAAHAREQAVRGIGRGSEHTACCLAELGRAIAGRSEGSFRSVHGRIHGAHDARERAHGCLIRGAHRRARALDRCRRREHRLPRVHGPVHCPHHRRECRHRRVVSGFDARHRGGREAGACGGRESSGGGPRRAELPDCGCDRGGETRRR
mmetsp:Transcript_9964/g.27071  ORF Transcript_9964/g.27071 Transcript_9964/m.27071 type:complete len:360 (-) Transcript_9964:7-1086(-)